MGDREGRGADTHSSQHGRAGSPSLQPAACRQAALAAIPCTGASCRAAQACLACCPGAGHRPRGWISVATTRQLLHVDTQHHIMSSRVGDSRTHASVCSEVLYSFTAHRCVGSWCAHQRRRRGKCVNAGLSIRKRRQRDKKKPQPKKKKKKKKKK